MGNIGGFMIFFFPGQGSQFVGMGEELVSKYDIAKRIFSQANDVLNYDLQKLCLEGPEDQLTNTQYAQPAILTYQYILSSLLKNNGIIPSAVAGHSLGEFSAILASEMLDFEKILRIVQKRGKLMAASDPSNRGSMAVILGLDDQVIIDICKDISQESYVEAVNFNTPGQVVISGYKDAVDKAGQIAIQNGAKRVLPLAVSGAFHSKLMNIAAEDFSNYIKDVNFNPPKFPIISNVTAEFYTEQNIKELLPLQMKSPVQWVKSINYLVSRGFTKGIEVSNGSIISGMVRKITKEIVMTNIKDNNIV